MRYLLHADDTTEMEVLVPNGAAGSVAVYRRGYDFCGGGSFSIVADLRRATTARGWPKLRPMSGPLEDDEDGYCGFKRSNWAVGPCQLVCPACPC